MKYLIIKCEELDYQWECDADRTPILITDDKSKYGRGYEVWQINDDGTLTRIKEYETPLEKGMALYYWKDGEEEDGVEPEIPGSMGYQNHAGPYRFFQKSVYSG